VKALVEFPSVLANMDKNLSWTSSLGDAYVNQAQDVMKAVQVMRDRAQKAGNLKSTSQEKVSNQGQNIMIEPADPEVVYVPEYDPWLVYGDPIGIWPGWYWYPGLFFDGPGIAFGFGFGIGFFGGFGWDGGTGDMTGTITGLFQPWCLPLSQQGFRQSQQLQSRRWIPWRWLCRRRGFGELQHGFGGTHPSAFSGLIVEESREASPPVGNRALAEDSTVEVSEVEVSTVAEAVVANSV